MFKNLHLLLSHECLQTVIYSPKSNTSSTLNGEQTSSSDYTENKRTPTEPNQQRDFISPLQSVDSWDIGDTCLGQHSSRSSNTTHNNHNDGNQPKDESNHTITTTLSMDSTMQPLTSHWKNTLNLIEQPSPISPMIFLLWNSKGIHSNGFKAYFRELLNYHKPSFIVLIEAKAKGDEADIIMAQFKF